MICRLLKKKTHFYYRKTHDDFLNKLILAFEFIDLYDLLPEFTKDNPSKTPWCLYQTSRASDDLDNWTEAIKQGHDCYKLVADQENNIEELLGILVLLNKIISRGERHTLPPSDEERKKYLRELVIESNFYTRDSNDNRECPAAGRVKYREKDDGTKHVIIVNDNEDDDPTQRHKYDERITSGMLKEVQSDPDIKIYKSVTKTVEPKHEADILVRMIYIDEKKLARCRAAFTEIQEEGLKNAIEKLYLNLIKIHPFSDYNGRTLRAFFKVVRGYPLFMRCWDLDQFLSLEDFKAEIELSRTWYVKIMADFYRELEAAGKENNRIPEFYNTHALWLCLLNINPDTMKTVEDKGKSQD